MRWLSRVVSIIVILAVVAAGFLLLRAKVPATKIGQSFTAWALFRDASRVATGSSVMIAGVRVGDVSRLSVQGVFARIDLRLRNDIDVPSDSWITKKAESAFGDSYIEIIPGSGEEGAPTARRLRSGEQIVHVIEGGSTDTVLRSVARTMPKVDNGLDAIHDFALEARKWASGVLQDRITGADRWLAEGHIDQPLTAADQAMARFERGATRAADAIATAKPQVDHTLDRINRAVTSTRKQMASVKAGLHDGLENARQGFDRIDPTVEQLTDVMTAVNEGRGDDFKGKLGRLINDPELAGTIEDATDSVRDATSSLDKFKAWLGFRTEFNVFSRMPRVYVTAEIRARNDKFYLIEVEKGPLGGQPGDQLSDAAGTPSYTRSQELHDVPRFTAQFGKTLFTHYRLRGGMKESTFGLGADLLLNDGKLRFSADLFGSFDRTPRFKVAGALEVFRSVYLLAGIDDALNTPGYLSIIKGNTSVPTQFENVRFGRDYFLGATLQFTDADLATILRVYGALIIGLL